jgi:hypothetical protein
MHLLSAWHIVLHMGILWLQSSRLDRPVLTSFRRHQLFDVPR